MNLVLLAGPPEQIPENPWPGLEIFWTSPDGATTWALTNESSPVRLLEGTRGLGKPPTTRYSDESPGLSGSTHRGHRFEEREVYWPFVVLAGASTQEHLDIDAQFWDSLRVQEQGTWRVVTPDGSERSMRLRFAREEKVWDFTPGLTEWSIYGVYLVANDPFWSSPLVVREFLAAAEGARFADPATPALWHISSGSTMAQATITNPGDVNGWPIWWWHGPFDSTFAGVDGVRITVPFSVAAGKTLVMDTSPADRRALQVDTPDLQGLTYEEQLAVMTEAMKTGTDRTISLDGETGFAPVPPGRNVALDLGMVGAGSAAVLLRPQHERAWG